MDCVCLRPAGADDELTNSLGVLLRVGILLS